MRLQTTRRALSLDEEMLVVKAVTAQIVADLARLGAGCRGLTGGGSLLRGGALSGPSQSLAERTATAESEPQIRRVLEIGNSKHSSGGVLDGAARF